jgi:hypothetical protein
VLSAELLAHGWIAKMNNKRKMQGNMPRSNAFDSSMLSFWVVASRAAHKQALLPVIESTSMAFSVSASVGKHIVERCRLLRDARFVRHADRQNSDFIVVRKHQFLCARRKIDGVGEQVRIRIRFILAVGCMPVIAIPCDRRRLDKSRRDLPGKLYFGSGLGSINLLFGFLNWLPVAPQCHNLIRTIFESKLIRVIERGNPEFATRLECRVYSHAHNSCNWFK